MKNYTVKEAINAIMNNDTDAIKEIAKYFPQFLIIVVRGDWGAFANALPDALTLRKLSFDATAAAPVEDAEEAVTMPAPMEEAAEDDEAEEVDLSTLPVKTLIKMCEDAGHKVARFGKPKTYYIDILNGNAEPEQTFEGKEDKRVTERKAAKKEAVKTAKKNAAAGNYTEMKASELFALCQERGIEAATKQKAAYYIKKLEAYDAENGEEAEEVKPTPKKTAAKAAPKAAPKKAPKKEEVEEDPDEAEDWDDVEEEEEEAPKKAPKKAAAPAKKAPAKKAPAKKAPVEEEDDDEPEVDDEPDDEDDWDI